MTCQTCGSDVSGKKFCQECGTPTRLAQANVSNHEFCPRCHGEVKAGTRFCMHCGAALHDQSSAPIPPPPPATRPCQSCHIEVPIETAFCTSCGHDMRVNSAMPQMGPSSALCTSCGRQNAPGTSFCGGCGSQIAPAAPVAQGYTQYPQSGQYPQPYGQPQYPQAGYQPQPILGQQPMVLRCPTCMAISPMGTAACPSCRTNLAGVVPTPANMPAQGQGGLGGFMQGSGGKVAMGVVGGAAAVLGGQMLMNGIENMVEDRVEENIGFGHQHGHHHRGLLGGLAEMADDAGLI